MPGWLGFITIASATVCSGTPLGVKPTGLTPPSGPKGPQEPESPSSGFMKPALVSGSTSTSPASPQPPTNARTLDQPLE
ncbi:Uncharacterised protein [Mycobacterium tuberculosis]|nr:Uncharacterised protein [Mycobacterium tuberculosis]